MIHFPTTVDEAVSLATGGQDGRAGVYRAGGTDLQDLRAHVPIAERPPLVDLRDIPGLDSVVADPSGAWIGALTRASTIAAHPELRARWSGLAETCAALAPQVRSIATIAGNLMQAPRCWYYRHPDVQCLRQGGSTCFARQGDHLFHVAFDRGGCVAPHPSTLAAVLVAYEAEVERLVPGVVEPRRAPVLDILEPGALEPGALITAIHLGPPQPGERTAYARAANRAHAEWALVEASVRLVVAEAGTIEFARVGVGAVATTPLRLDAVEATLVGRAPEPEVLAEAAALAREGAKPLPMTAYKLELLEGCVLEALERALEASPSPMTEANP